VLYQYQGDHDRSIENSRKLIELDPSFPFAYQYLALSQLKKGRNEEAIKNLEKAVEISGRDRNALSDLGYGYGVTGQRKKALAIAKELEAKHAKKEAHGYYVAPVYWGFGDKDKALEWLEKDFEANASVERIKREIMFDSSLDDPLYKEWLRRMGLPE
jgi:tetratricopeptide (TPR) repeat protein